MLNYLYDGFFKEKLKSLSYNKLISSIRVPPKEIRKKDWISCFPLFFEYPLEKQTVRFEYLKEYKLLKTQLFSTIKEIFKREKQKKLMA